MNSENDSCKKARIEENLIKIVLKWNNGIYHLDVDPEDDFAILKHKIETETEVKPTRQKILLKGKGGIKVCDDTKMCDLDIKEGKPFVVMMIGSREADIESVQKLPTEEQSEVVNDFEDEQGEAESFENKEVYLAKIRRRVKEYKIEILNQPREGKRLLVLDIDYTLFDHRSSAETGVELMRPYLHEFLTSAYEHYDIAIWSATSMKWIIEKMKLLGVHNNENYKIVFYLDSRALISVHCEKRGVVDVKPLAVIWEKFNQYSNKNTIMFDDIRRNFLMNRQSGLRIKPFSHAFLNREKDTELLKLAAYLKSIAENCDDFTKLNHRKWESYNK
jgi:ubiquitin-like domain-containing CTD phosphatase 1